MDVQLTPEIQEYVESQVKAGRFDSIDDAVNGLLSAAKWVEQLTAKHAQARDEDIPRSGTYGD
jgi:Arc/MetJ-type ribon-helix-helix transcriptional regulator